METGSDNLLTDQFELVPRKSGLANRTPEPVRLFVAGVGAM